MNAIKPVSAAGDLARARVTSCSNPIQCALLLAASLSCASLCSAQIPRVNTFFPQGGRAGTTVELEVRGSSLQGANMLLVHGEGVSGVVQPGDAKVDEANKPLWQSKCASCHDLRSPANRSMTPAQWAATVERMVKVRNAPISTDEAVKITDYLTSAARAGRVTAKVSVAPNTLPGIYELRVATPRGVSSPCFFEVGGMPEVIGANGKLADAQPVTLPVVANGCFMSGGERHYYRFNAKQGERLVFNLKSFRYSESRQFYFSPNLRLYDGAGKEIAEDHGYYDLDPVIDWTCPTDGSYTVEARDLLGRANPDSVYRLTMGSVPFDIAIYPPLAQVGVPASIAVTGKNAAADSAYTLPSQTDLGVIRAPSPYGPQNIYVSPYPVVRDETGGGGGAPPSATLPALMGGRIAKPGEVDTFTIQGDGMFEFEGFANRLGSQVSLGVSLVNAKGAGVSSFGGDGRMTAKLEPGQAYRLTVANGNGQGGPAMVYAIEARPARPGLELVARPENVTIRPGASVNVEVSLTRRENIEGDIVVTAEDLPPGVSVNSAVIQPDRGVCWLRLTASPDAKPLEKPIRIVASGRGPSGEAKVRATPQEFYLLNGQGRTRTWLETMLVVRGEPQFTVAFAESGPIRVHPRKATPVKVKIQRLGGFKGGVTVFLSGLPLGWVANAESTDKDELTLTVRQDGNNTDPFLKRDPKWTPISAVLEAQSDEFRLAFGTVQVIKVDVIRDDD